MIHHKCYTDDCRTPPGGGGPEPFWGAVRKDRVLSSSSPSANLAGEFESHPMGDRGENSPVTTGQRPTTVKVVVATTVMLSFISFWRAAAIVLSDLASSAYYVGGIAETAIGKAAPWFILAIMLFSYAVRAIYIESCSMFVRGGVYKVVHEAMGGTLPKFSVSALMFDYVLTGPISGVSAGLYLAGLVNEIGEHMHIPWLKLRSEEHTSELQSHSFISY